MKYIEALIFLLFLICGLGFIAVVIGGFIGIVAGAISTAYEMISGFIFLGF